MNTLPKEIKEKIIKLRKLLKENAPIVYQKYSALKIERERHENNQSE